MASNCHIGMKIGKFESSDSEETFYFIYGDKTFRKFLNTQESGSGKKIRPHHTKFGIGEGGHF